MFQSRWLLPLLTVCLAATAMADVRFVDAEAESGGDGRSWGTAYRYLQDAVFEARGDAAVSEIRIAGGVYYPDEAETVVLPPRDPDLSFEIRGRLTVLGGFRGPGEVGEDPDERDPNRWQTELSGRLSRGERPTRGTDVLIDVFDAELDLDGVRLTLAFRAVQASKSVLRLRDVHLLRHGYLGIETVESELDVRGCVFDGILSTLHLSVVDPRRPTKVQGCRFLVPGDVRLGGQGVIQDCVFDSYCFVFRGARELVGCQFAGSDVLLTPGAGETTVLRQCYFEAAEQVDIYDATLVDCTVVGDADDWNLPNATLRNCVFRDTNFRTQADDTVFEACRFERVNADEIVRNGVAYFERCAFFDCSLGAVSEGEGLVRGCLFVRNEITSDIAGAGRSVDFCTFVDTTGRPRFNARNSLVAGGDARITQDTFEIREAGFVDPENDDYRLRADSPAINAALDPNASYTLDLDGNPRVHGAAADLGAFEAVFDDCDADGHPDIERIRRHTSQQGLDTSVPATWTLARLPAATGAVVLDVRARGPFRQTTRFVEVSLGGDTLAQIFVEDIGQDCGDYGDESIRIPADTFNLALGQDGPLDLVFTVIDPGPRCDLDMLLRLEYDAKLDADGSGTIDECQRRGDLDGDGVVGLSDLARVLASFGQVGEGVPGDVDLDGDVDVEDLAIVLAAFGS